jgi:hypothetical protein
MKKIILLSLITLLSACSTNTTQQNAAPRIRPVSVQVRYDTQAIPDGSVFSWSSELTGMYQDARLNHTNMDDLLKKGIVIALIEKGYGFTENASGADYTIAYTAALESALSDDDAMQTFGVLPGLVVGKDLVHNAEKGTLVIDVINQTTGRMYWRSSGQALARLEQMPQQQRQQRINQFIKMMLSDL